MASTPPPAKRRSSQYPKSNAIYWAVGGLAVVGLFVYLRGRASVTATTSPSGPTGQVPTSIADALTPTAAGAPPGTTTSTDTSSDSTFPQGDLGTDTTYEPADTATALGYTSGTYGVPAYAASSPALSMPTTTTTSTTVGPSTPLSAFPVGSFGIPSPVPGATVGGALIAGGAVPVPK